MLFDFEVQRSSRHCAATNVSLEPGDTCYSVLELQGGEVIRKDYARAAWTEPPQGSFAWWKTQVPEPVAKKIKLAPNDVLLELFDQLADSAEQADMRYVLTLLLVRRRVFRLESAPETMNEQADRVRSDGSVETMNVYCTKRDASYCVSVAMPGGARIDEIQQQLSDLLIAGAE